MKARITRKPETAFTPQPEGPPVRDLFRKLESLERELESTVHTGHNRWMVPYADLLTLLLGLFLVLFTASKLEIQKLNEARQSKPTAAVSAIQPEPLSKGQSPQALSAQLKKRFKMQGVEILDQPRGVVISLKDSVLFPPGSAELSPAARKTLNQLLTELKLALGGQSRSIRVEGHTDNTPITTSRYPSNWELSTARATHIIRYLIGAKQFQADKLSAAGYGEFRPIAKNSSIEGKQKNRRVDIVVLNENMALQEPPVNNSDSSLSDGISPNVRGLVIHGQTDKAQGSQTKSGR
ncbi:flagellar motor protein MotB [Vampirovibrio sp.]|uniref:OmpA/MotB family protein n=1 Tax=Vampirovibrio sp. TaxID=2717857 RepID=UPI00359470DD